MAAVWFYVVPNVPGWLDMVLDGSGGVLKNSHSVWSDGLNQRLLRLVGRSKQETRRLESS